MLTVMSLTTQNKQREISNFSFETLTYRNSLMSAVIDDIRFSGI